MRVAVQPLHHFPFGCVLWRGVVGERVDVVGQRPGAHNLQHAAKLIRPEYAFDRFPELAAGAPAEPCRVIFLEFQQHIDRTRGARLRQFREQDPLIVAFLDHLPDIDLHIVDHHIVQGMHVNTPDLVPDSKRRHGALSTREARVESGRDAECAVDRPASLPCWALAAARRTLRP